MKKREPIDPFVRAMKYCAYQERCHAEVVQKLKEWEVRESEANGIIAELIQQGFLNDERFAKAFAGGKFRTQKWGRLKIERELKMRNISSVCIGIGMKEILEEDYVKTLNKLIAQKSKEVKGKSALVKNHKIAQWLMGKGYEPEYIWARLKSQNNDPY